MAIRITLECGHTSTLRPRTTPEGYTHDWEVFVRGVDNADISQYVDKVVFQLHETFPKPKRVLKDAPYVLKESGYAGFVLPIYVYLKNKDEPKKIEISYDLTLQPSGPAINNVVRHSEVIGNPPDDFRRKLLKGGGVPVSTSNEPHDKSDQKLPIQMVGKPKLSGSDSKKHRPMEPRSTNQFAHLFGVPIKTSTKVSPESKKPLPPPPHKPPDPSKPPKSKHSPHKDPKAQKTEEKPKKDAPKDKDRSKDKQKPSQTPPPSKRPQSPSKKLPTPPDPTIQKSSSPKIPKDHKKIPETREKHSEKPKDPVKPPEDPKTDKKKKKHKDDKESDRKHKNTSKNQEKSKESKPAEPKKSERHEKPEKLEKEKVQENRVQKEIKRSPKPSKEGERSSSRSRPEVDKPKEAKVEKERPKHKHRKKDKKERSDDSREREKREKKEKKVLEKDAGKEPVINPLSTLLAEADRDSSDSANSGDDEEKVGKSEMVAEARLRPSSPNGSGKVKEKPRREKSKPKAEERDRKRKRRSNSKGDDEAPAKREKDPSSPPLEPVSSSQSPAADVLGYSTVKEERKEAFETEQIAPDSTNMMVESEEEPLVFSEDYVSQLKELQQKIMTLQDNQELQRVVQVIAATGQYEITRKTFDFDLCALDRRTVQRLQEFFSGS